ncbi:GlsB/YeaQ/YmgE family stress response membrane protein [Actinomadura sp. WMMA1423]|uniref:GlsB/YeaQ/YmgE family stress response membrane protein n=1 Tax=Actinomadura sp. WMMA1423 TaxID=2591108 RepID=UPI0011473BA5|nr:GlsB/YeaQ/YmgE family stress response membrane protein [Actinomadura sp. WMMA1423]
MTIGGIVAAVVLGAAIGVLSRFVLAGRKRVPAWLLATVGVVAAFAGTGLVHLSDLGDGGWNVWEALFQSALPVAAILLVAAFWPERGAATRDTGRRPPEEP